VRMPAEGVRSTSEVRVAAESPPFELKRGDGRPKAAKGIPDEIGEALRTVPASVRWKGVSGHGGDGTIAIDRRGAAGGEWLLDLWWPSAWPRPPADSGPDGRRCPRPLW
jgi:hypothetical protein